MTTSGERSETTTSPFRLGAWRVEPETGRVSDGDREASLEPRLMALLTLLAAQPGRVHSRETIEAALWPDVVVGEDTVARAISRLRRALGDSAQSPRYIETLPKRGYRLIEPITPIASASGGSRKASRRWLGRSAGAAVAVAVVVWLALQPRVIEPVTDPLDFEVARANDLYMRFTRADNEAAIGLYERVLAEQPDNAAAQSGLANALVQRVVRWPGSLGSSSTGASSLTEALDRGLTRGAAAAAVLERATAIAERAVRLAPENPDALKSLAFTVTAQGDLDRAEALYEDVLALDADAWESLINLGEIATMRGNEAAAVDYFERAYAAMSRAYAYEPQRVGPWQVALGVAIGERYETLGQPTEAELWYRRVLAEAPYEPEATVRLARLLAASGNAADARALCRTLTERVSNYTGCADL